MRYLALVDLFDGVHHKAGDFIRLSDGKGKLFTDSRRVVPIEWLDNPPGWVYGQMVRSLVVFKPGELTRAKRVYGIDQPEAILIMLRHKENIMRKYGTLRDIIGEVGAEQLEGWR